MGTALEEMAGSWDTEVLADRLFDVMTVLTGAAALLERRWEELGPRGRADLIRAIDKGVERGATLLAGRDLPWLEWQLDHYFVMVRMAVLTLGTPGAGEEVRRDALGAIRSGAPLSR